MATEAERMAKVLEEQQKERDRILEQQRIENEERIKKQQSNS